MTTLTIEQALALAKILNDNPSIKLPFPIYADIPPERPVLVTTEHRGVFFGYATNTTGPTIKLRAARNCIYWSPATKGFLGLVGKGPDGACRIGPAANIELRNITCVAEVTPEAVTAWESAPWRE